MKIKALVLASALALCSLSLRAQTPPSTNCSLPIDLCESAYSVALYGNYSLVNNVPTNNGWMTGGALNVTTHFGAEVRYYQTGSPSASLFLPGVIGRFSLAHVLPASAAASTFNPENFEVFVHGNAGFGSSNGTDASGNPVSGAKKPAFAIGGGFDYANPAAPNVQFRILDVSYVHSDLFPTHGVFLGNHVALVSGIKIVFGGSNAPASLRKFALVHKKVQ